MIKHVFYDNKTRANYERISKAKAFKMWQQGREIIICPAKLRPFAPWNPEMNLASLERHKESYKGKQDKEYFQDSIRNFEYHNCNNETGKTAAFYVKIGENK